MTSPRPSNELNPIARLAIDFGPLVIFFAVYNLARAKLFGLAAFGRRVATWINEAAGTQIMGAHSDQPIYLATEATMVASVVAVIISLSLTRKISPALIITSGMVLLFGGATIYLDDPHFIKIKPTIVYAMYAVALLGGAILDRPLLKFILGQGFPPMAHTGWIKLSRNFGLFFAFMGCLNEFMWRSFSEKTWVDYDVWGVVALTAAFMGSQYTVISKYMEEEPKPADNAEIAAAPPPPG